MECMKLQSAKSTNHQIIVPILPFKRIYIYIYILAIQKYIHLAKTKTFTQPNQDISQFSYTAKVYLKLELKMISFD